jgi:hypothetical protein
MSSKKEVIFYENIYQVGPETCEYILDKGILRSDNWLDDTSYPKGTKEIKAEDNQKKLELLKKDLQEGLFL